MKILVDEVGELFAPRVCPGCGRRPDVADVPLCSECLVKLPRCNAELCRQRLLPLLDAAPCAAGIVASWSPYVHDGVSARMIRGVKYYSRPYTGIRLGELIGRELAATSAYDSAEGLKPADIEVFLPVPLHWSKLLRRGYNQSRCIAEGLADALGGRVGDNLVALKRHKTQTHRSAEARAANVKGIYGVIACEELDGRNVAIVDDVITTGATINECVIAIGRSGARPSSLSVISAGLSGEDL